MHIKSAPAFKIPAIPFFFFLGERSLPKGNKMLETYSYRSMHWKYTKKTFNKTGKCHRTVGRIAFLMFQFDDNFWFLNCNLFTKLPSMPYYIQKITVCNLQLYFSVCGPFKFGWRMKGNSSEKLMNIVDSKREVEFNLKAIVFNRWGQKLKNITVCLRKIKW